MFHKRRLRRQLKRALQELPDYSGDIASKLEEEGVRGSISDAVTCPLARWISARVTLAGNEEVRVYSGRARVVALDEHGDSKADTVEAKLSLGQRNFIRQFDRGCFPQLVGTPSTR